MARLARWGALLLVAAPIGAWALGLGDIELKSALNQPLLADIELVSATPEELAALRIGLANSETFSRYGIDRPSFLSGLEFNVTKDEQGRDVVRVTSRSSMTEPFVTMLIEATWARGRLLREYTVLLDPPVLLPGPPESAVAAHPAESGRAATPEPAATIARPAPRAAPPPPPRPEPAPANRASPPTAGVTPASVARGNYGPVQRGETLWGIASGMRPGGVTMNQIMLAIYRANPDAFDGNMNLLHRGAVLRIPPVADMTTLTAAAATSEAQRQIDAWNGRATQPARLRLVPASDAAANANPAPQAAAGAAASAGGGAGTAELEQQVSSLRSQLDENKRLLSVRDDQLRELQNQLDARNATPAATEPAPAPAASTSAEPGVDLESEPVFVDEQQGAPAGGGATEPGAQPTSAEPAETAPAQTEPTPAATAAPTPTPPAAATRSVVTTRRAPSLLERMLGWLMSPILFIGLGVVAVLGAAAWYLRHRREEAEDVTGRWEALEAEVDADDTARSATERLRRQVPDDTGVVVVEQPSRRSSRPRKEPEGASLIEPQAEEEPKPEQTISSQTIIDLDQGDAIAEADFHMAYGLYDQAAELINKALQAEPGRRDLKLKLLEVFFVWGNKESFLDAAKALRAEMGNRLDGDWDKVIIMGKQICPDEPLFAAATASAGAVDVDLEAGESALDFNLESKDEPGLDMDFAAFGGDDGEASGREAATEQTGHGEPAGVDEDFDLLDIGERTAAGLESVFEDNREHDPSARTTPDAVADSLAVTQESPTIETPRGSDRDEDQDESIADATVEELGANAPTVEALGPHAPTVEHPRLGEGTGELPTIEQPKLTERADQTAEIDLDDLGLDVDDLPELSGEEGLGDLDAETGTREQEEDDGLSASRITRVLEGDDDPERTGTEILSDQDATLLAPGFDDDTLSGTAVLAQVEGEDVEDSGGTERFRIPDDASGLDLNLEDLSAALDGAETVEQPSSQRFSDVFGGEGDGTPVDLDVGLELSASDDPTGTEEFNELDPQTLTEVGTKLDLARAYIDMGDPEGARSILEEVLDEGDSGQRREAQNLIDVLRT
jgi:pilus assembly protein FimV